MTHFDYWILALMHNRSVWRTAAGLYVKGAVSSKNETQTLSYVHSSRKNWKCKYITMRIEQVEFNP